MNFDCSDASEVSSYCSDNIDSDLEVELYGMLHHEPNRHIEFLHIHNLSQPSVTKNEGKNTDLSRSQFFNGLPGPSSLQKALFVESDDKIPQTQRDGSNIRFVHKEENGSDPGRFSKKRFLDSPLVSHSSPKDNNVEGHRNKHFNSCKSENKKVKRDVIKISDSNKFLFEGRLGPIMKGKKEHDNFANYSTSEPPHKRKKLNTSPEVITIIDDDEVIDINYSTEYLTSNSSIEVLSSSDNDDDIIIDEGKSTDIIINLHGAHNFQYSSIDIDDEWQKMPGNPELWRVNEKDRFPKAYRKTYEYQRDARLVKITCLNCRERGHLSKNCTKPRKVVICYLCGNEGHDAPHCSRPACIRCMSIGHCVEQCRWPDKCIEKKCPSCNMKGHLREECPDNWRKYHLTTVDGPINKSAESPPVRKMASCYNCGAFGHLGHKCHKKRMHNRVYPCLPWVVNYEKSSTEKGEQPNKDRENFLTKLYNKKQRLTEMANTKYLKQCCVTRTSFSGRAKFQRQKSKKIGQKRSQKRSRGESFCQTFTQNGQLHYPRTVTVEENNFATKMKSLPKRKKKQQCLLSYKERFTNFFQPAYKK